MKITLKNVKYYPKFSRYSNAFTASIYVDGKREGECYDDGQGGYIEVSPPELSEKIGEYCKTLPHWVCSKGVSERNGIPEGYTMPITTNTLLLEQLVIVLREREAKKKERV